MPFPHERHASPIRNRTKWDEEPRRLQDGSLTGNPLCCAICFSKLHDSSNHFKPWDWCKELGYCRPHHLLFRLYSKRNFEELGYKKGNYRSVPVTHYLAPGPEDENYFKSSPVPPSASSAPFSERADGWKLHLEGSRKRRRIYPKPLTAPPGSACLTPPAHVGGGNVKWPSRRFSGSTDIDGALCWGIYGVSPTGKHTQDARWWEYDDKGVVVLDADRLRVFADVSTQAKCIAHNVPPRWRRVAYETHEVILDPPVPAEAIITHHTLADFLMATYPADAADWHAEHRRRYNEFWYWMKGKAPAENRPVWLPI